MGSVKKDDLLRRLEERLARGEISEKTYLDIRARYDAMPDVPEPPEPPTPPKAAEAGPQDFETLIQRTVESAMEHAAASLEAAFATRPDADERIREMNVRLQKAFGKFGTQVEAGGKRIVIRGAGVVAGDQKTEEFRSAGSCRVAGNLHATTAHISGSCVVEGDCLCQEFHAAGKAEIKGGVKAHEFHVAGKASVGKDVSAKEVSVAGKVAIRGSVLDAEDVSLSGSINVGGWVRTKDFKSKGQFEIGEGLEAEDVEIRLSGTSRVPLIRARDVTVRRGDRNGELLVGTIEGKDVSLESTQASLVRGDDVRIGPYCTVNVVEADELEVHESSTVKERRPRAADA